MYVHGDGFPPMPFKAGAIILHPEIIDGAVHPPLPVDIRMFGCEPVLYYFARVQRNSHPASPMR